MIQSILWVIGATLGVLILLTAMNRLFGVVLVDVPRWRLFDDCLDYYALHGRNGARVSAYHKPSGILILIVKWLSPDWSSDGEVELRVRKVQIRDHERFQRTRRRPPGGTRSWRTRFAAHRRLPRERDGELLEEIECGASLVRLREAVERIIAEEPRLDGEPVFDVWPWQCYAIKVFGEFKE